MLILERLNQLFNEKPDKVAITYLDDIGNEIHKLTYKDFDNKTRELACVIKSKDGWNIPEDSTVLLVYPPSIDFLICFVACLRAKVIPVPVFPPDPTKLKKNVYLFTAVQESSQSKYALTNSEYYSGKKLGDLKTMFSFESKKWPELTWLITDTSLPKLSDKIKSKIELDNVNPEHIAFLQYTSGSTSSPKGVIVKHRNLEHNIILITKSLEGGDFVTVVSWLPQYHDMGLIGSFLSCMYNGGTGIYMSPVSFIKNPTVWLECVSKYHATHLQAPNFAYSLVARKLSPTFKGDLSTVRHMFNAAEPITAEAIDSFLDKVKQFGFNPNSIKPGYGLAEHVVYVCDGGKLRLKLDKKLLEEKNIVQLSTSENKTEYTLLIGNGKPSKNPEVDVRIVDPNTLSQLPDGQVGEIWINSPSKADGYYNLPDVTKQEFHATIKNVPNVDFLKSGDLGFLYEGELFICGRSKDLIVIRGRNHYPQDIEHTIESYQYVRGGCVAAFSIESAGIEALVVVLELRDINPTDLTQKTQEIIGKVNTDHGVNIHDLVIVEQRSIPKTTSGKIARQRTKLDYIENKLKIISTSRNNIIKPKEVKPLDKNVADMSLDEIYLSLINDMKGLVETLPSGNFANIPLNDIGFDSLAVTQLKGLLSQRYMVTLTDELIYEPTTTTSMIYTEMLKQMGISQSDIDDQLNRINSVENPEDLVIKKKTNWVKTCCPFLSMAMVKIIYNFLSISIYI